MGSPMEKRNAPATAFYTNVLESWKRRRQMGNSCVANGNVVDFSPKFCLCYMGSVKRRKSEDSCLHGFDDSQMGCPTSHSKPPLLLSGA